MKIYHLLDITYTHVDIIFSFINKAAKAQV